MPMSLLGITSMCMPKMKSIGTAVNAWSTTQTDRHNVKKYIDIMSAARNGKTPLF